MLNLHLYIEYSKVKEKRLFMNHKQPLANHFKFYRINLSQKVHRKHLH